MPDIFPFRAYRYNGTSAQMRNLVCPPYDVISSASADKLRKNPENAIHLELPAGNSDKKYDRARTLWTRWTQQGVLRKDALPAFYVYEQIFSERGKKTARRGFFCLLKLEKPGAGSVLRHELTLSGPKLDRLKLLRALRVNTSPIFGLFDDSRGMARKTLSEFSKQKEAARFMDPDHILHRLWLCTDKAACEAIMALMARETVAIADGHHRYETAWNYSRELGTSESNMALFFLCPAQDRGLVVYPTHRVMRQGSFQDILARLLKMRDVFALKQVTAGEPTRGSFRITNAKQFFEVRPKSLRVLGKAMPGKSADYLKLALAQVHDLLVPEMRKEDFIYSHDSREAVSLAKKLKSCAILAPAVSVRELYSVVRAGELMPQKSTYFSPKVTTGLLFRSLE